MKNGQAVYVLLKMNGRNVMGIFGNRIKIAELPYAV